MNHLRRKLISTSWKEEMGDFIFLSRKSLIHFFVCFYFLFGNFCTYTKVGKIAGRTPMIPPPCNVTDLHHFDNLFQQLFPVPVSSLTCTGSRKISFLLHLELGRACHWQALCQPDFLLLPKAWSTTLNLPLFESSPFKPMVSQPHICELIQTQQK